MGVGRSFEAEATPVSEMMGDSDVTWHCPVPLDDAVKEIGLSSVDSQVVETAITADIEILADEQPTDEKHSQSKITVHNAVHMLESEVSPVKPEQDVLGPSSEIVTTDACKHAIEAVLQELVPMAEFTLIAESKAVQEPGHPAAVGIACVLPSPEALAAPAFKMNGDSDVAQDRPKPLDGTVEETALPSVDSQLADAAGAANWQSFSADILADEQKADKKHSQGAKGTHCAKCGDTSKRGLFGCKGWGLVSRQCRHCVQPRAAAVGCRAICVRFV